MAVHQTSEFLINPVLCDETFFKKFKESHRPQSAQSKIPYDVASVHVKKPKEAVTKAKAARSCTLRQSQKQQQEQHEQQQRSKHQRSRVESVTPMQSLDSPCLSHAAVRAASGSAGISPMRAAMLGQVSSLQEKLFEAQAKLEHNQLNQVALLASQSQLKVELAEAKSRELSSQLQTELKVRAELDRSRAEGVEARENELRQMGEYKARAEMQARMTATQLEYANARAEQQERSNRFQAEMHQGNLRFQTQVAFHGMAMGSGGRCTSSRMCILKSFQETMQPLQQPQLPQQQQLPPQQPAQAVDTEAIFCHRCGTRCSIPDAMFCFKCCTKFAR